MAGGRFFVGVDLGQSQDYTAIAVVERAVVTGGWDPVMYGWRRGTVERLRYLERVALGTPYPDVVARVRRVARSADLAGQCYVMADATGVGRPVVDLLRRAGMECRILPVVVTSGDVERVGQDGYYRVPKRDLIVGMQVLLQRGRLQIVDGLEHGPALVNEMVEMRVKVTCGGHEQYGVWREGAHDDLVFAVALGCWGVGKVYPRDGVEERRGRES